MQIADWLQKLGMSEYAQRFAENRIDLSVLPDLTDQDLEKMGVVLGDRRKILRAISLIASEAPAVPQAKAEQWFHAEVHRVRGELLLQRQPPDFAAAEAAFKLAIEIARRQKTRTFELRAAVALATIYKEKGQDQAARQLLGPALAEFG